MTVKRHSSRRCEKVQEFMKINCRHLLFLSRDIAVDVGKSPGVYENKLQASTVTVKGHSSRRWENLQEFMKINSRHLL